MSLETSSTNTKTKENKVKGFNKIFCHAQLGNDDDPNYHLCKYKKDHEDDHKCCACAVTW
jgi:hypothetical protein